jgi:hypothetical protein
MFKSSSNKGFSLTFENGNTVSVQWGSANYCSPTHAAGRGAPLDAPMKTEIWSAENAEVAAWNEAGEWHNFGYDTVDGWKTTNDVAAFIDFVANNELHTSVSEEDE